MRLLRDGKKGTARTILEGDFFSTFLSIIVLSVQKDERLLRRREPSFRLFSILWLDMFVIIEQLQQRSHAYWTSFNTTLGIKVCLNKQTLGLTRARFNTCLWFGLQQLVAFNSLQSVPLKKMTKNVGRCCKRTVECALAQHWVNSIRGCEK